MKKFTIKDFILYNSPCFNCGHQFNFYFEIMKKDDIYAVVSKRAIITKESTKVELVIHYANNLIVEIDHKTNKFNVNNIQALTEYLADNNLSVLTVCSHCSARIESEFLKFNLEKKFVIPFCLKSESFKIQDKKKIYYYLSVFEKPESSYFYLYFDGKSGASKIDLPLTPLYKFKTRERLLKKLKTYILFS